MKKKQYFYKSCGRRIDILSINTWLRGCKDYSYSWDMLNQENVYGIRTLPKRRHKRSIVTRYSNRLFGEHRHPTMFTREAKPIGRRKRGKWVYLPKRVWFTGVK